MRQLRPNQTGPLSPLAEEKFTVVRELMNGVGHYLPVPLGPEPNPELIGLTLLRLPNPSGIGRLAGEFDQMEWWRPQSRITANTPLLYYSATSPARRRRSQDGEKSRHGGS